MISALPLYLSLLERAVLETLVLRGIARSSQTCQYEALPGNLEWMAMVGTDFDVIVVGAGPGGAASAYYLGDAGLRVLVVDKAHLPRYKACGGAIPRPTLERFPFPFEDVIQAAPSEVRITYPGLLAVNAPLPERTVAMVLRSEFDAYLLARADAEVLTGQPVTGVSENRDVVQVQVGEQQLSARYLVAADGAASTVARCLGLRRNRKLRGTLEAEIPLNGSQSLRSEYGDRAVFSLGVIPWGYVWLFFPGEKSWRWALANSTLGVSISVPRCGPNWGVWASIWMVSHSMAIRCPATRRQPGPFGTDSLKSLCPAIGVCQ